MTQFCASDVHISFCEVKFESGTKSFKCISEDRFLKVDSDGHLEYIGSAVFVLFNIHVHENGVLIFCVCA